MKKNYAATERR